MLGFLIFNPITAVMLPREGLEHEEGNALGKTLSSYVAP